MGINSQEIARKKLEAAIRSKKDQDSKANALIFTATAINAGLGAVPLGINIWTFIGVSSTMVGLMGTVYGYHLTNEGAGMALDAVLCGAVTYALGFTTKTYLINGRKMSPAEIKEQFKRSFAEGKTKVKDLM